MNRARILLADDHVANIELISDLLQPEFDVVAQVQDGTALVKAAAALAPDVIVCDISMPCLDAIGAAELILRRAPAARIVFVTVHGDPLMASRAMATGAMGYVLKLASGDDLLPAMRVALRGERHISGALCRDEGANIGGGEQ